MAPRCTRPICNVNTPSSNRGAVRVHNLLRTDATEQDAEVVRDLFPHREAELILSIPLCESVEKDRWEWTKETSRNYTTKSAYKLIQEY